MASLVAEEWWRQRSNDGPTWGKSVLFVFGSGVGESFHLFLIISLPSTHRHHHLPRCSSLLFLFCSSLSFDTWCIEAVIFVQNSTIYTLIFDYMTIWLFGLWTIWLFNQRLFVRHDLLNLLLNYFQLYILLTKCYSSGEFHFFAFAFCRLLILLDMVGGMSNSWCS